MAFAAASTVETSPPRTVKTAHGEDGIGGGADRALVSARVAGHRAHRVGARRCRTGGLEGGRPAADGRRAGRAGPRSGAHRAGHAECGWSVADHVVADGSLWDALSHAYDTLGFAQAAGGDEVFRQLVLTRIIEPTSKLDSLRVLDEAGVWPPSYRTVTRRLSVFARAAWRQRLAAASCAGHAGLGPASLVLYDVSTLYFETDAGDGFRQPSSPRSDAWSRRSRSGC